MNNEFKNIVKLCPHCNCVDYIIEIDSQYGNVATGNRRCLSCGRVFVENSKDKDRYDRFKYAVSINLGIFVNSNTFSASVSNCLLYIS